MKEEYFLPVIAHNMRDYDGHLIIKLMNKKTTCQDIQVIATNTEKFIAFEIGQLRFLDSLQFLNASLDALVNNLKRMDRRTHTKRHFSDKDQFERVTRKGVYPYEYMHSAAKFKETSLPPREKFYSSLCDENISEEDYQRAKDVWAAFKIQNMREYHDLYLKPTQSFSQTSLKIFGESPWTITDLTLAITIHLLDSAWRRA